MWDIGTATLAVVGPIALVALGLLSLGAALIYLRQARETLEAAEGEVALARVAMKESKRVQADAEGLHVLAIWKLEVLARIMSKMRIDELTLKSWDKHIVKADLKLDELADINLTLEDMGRSYPVTERVVPVIDVLCRIERELVFGRGTREFIITHLNCPSEQQRVGTKKITPPWFTQESWAIEREAFPLVDMMEPLANQLAQALLKAWADHYTSMDRPRSNGQ